jgi:hypothetical protein
MNSMLLDRLSARQLWTMRQNLRAYDKHLRALIEAEWQRRDLQDTAFPLSELEQAMQANARAPLAWHWRTLVVLLPFPSPLHPLIAARLMDGGFARMFHEYYAYRALGFGLWFGCVILLGKHFPFWLTVFLLRA